MNISMMTFYQFGHARPEENLPHQEGINEKTDDSNIQDNFYVMFKTKLLAPLKQKYPLLNSLNEYRKKLFHIK